jgi:dynein heavy chain 2
LSKGGVAQTQTVFALAWFHAVVQERRTYLPQGWCKFYEFSDGDLKAGLDVLEQLQKQQGGSEEAKWEFVHGLYANAIYGGRVDDTHDIKILASYLRNIFNADAISGSRPLGPFQVPSTGDARECFEIANRLPDEDKPSMFGLPANIERSHQRMSSTTTISQLKVLMRSVTGAAKFERDKWQKELTPMLNLWKKLNQGSSLLQTKLSQEDEGEDGSGGDKTNPVKAFVELEFRHGVTLLQKMHKSLSALSKVIRGQQLIDEEVSNLADSLLRQETPAKWLKTWDGPEDPMDYIETVVAKINEVQKWKSMASSLLSKDLDLSDLFHPDTFLGALRQETARQFGVSMGDLKLANSWARSGGISGSKISIRVEGLMMEGALFDGGKLAPSSHDSPSYSLAPTCTLAWVPKTERDNYTSAESIRLPMYYSNEREGIVAQLDLPCTTGDQDKWLQSGTVLFINSHI